MLTYILMLVAGLVILVLAGDRLVRGSVSAALRLGVSQILASILIVGFGTSIPEMLVAVQATVSGAPGMAMGNIVGSNIANILLVLGLPALFVSMNTQARGLKRSVFVTAAATIAWLVITPFFGLGPVIGIVFLVALLAYVLSALVLPSPEGLEELIDDEVRAPPASWVLTALFICIGLVGLPLGAHLAIRGASGLAATFSLNSELVGLTILAVGTSLPELAAALAAAMRKETDVIFGNVAGSNLFNILGAGGIISLLGQHSLPPIFGHFDHWVMGGVFAVFALYVIVRRSIGWLTGSVFILSYGGYLFGLYHFYVLGRHWSDLWI